MANRIHARQKAVEAGRGGTGALDPAAFPVPRHTSPLVVCRT
jgi:hypothetical protein